jgi:hypothetical protein
MSQQRIQRRREKGWTKPSDAVYVGRPGIFGNPFAPTVIPGWATASREYAVEDFRAWLADPGRFWRNTSGGFETREHSITARDCLMDALPRLRGKTLMCWCPVDQPCHADVLLELANTEDSELPGQTTIYDALEGEPA